MKKQLYIFLIILFTATACNKLPINGHLDGLWQLTSIDYNGEKKDTKANRIYYAFQLKLMGLQENNHMIFLGRFQQTPDSLFVYDFRKDITGDNSIEALPGDLSIWGIDGISERFGIEQLTDKQMILKSELRTLSFRKF